MDKKYIAVLILVIVLVAGGVALFMERSAVLNVTKKIAQNTNQQAGVVSIQDKKITDNTKPFKIDITYPQVAGQDKFNKTVQDVIDKEISDFKTNSLENDVAVKQVDPADYAKYPREYDLQIGYDKGEVDENIVSVVLGVYSFEGGAHGATNFTPINYSIKNKTEIQLADLFPEQTNYIQKISDFCAKDLTNQITKSAGNTQGTWISDGAGPVADNFKVFLINKDNIVFYFPQYQVAPGSYGDFKVIFPR